MLILLPLLLLPLNCIYNEFYSGDEKKELFLLHCTAFLSCCAFSVYSLSVCACVCLTFNQMAKENNEKRKNIYTCNKMMNTPCC